MQQLYLIIIFYIISESREFCEHFERNDESM